MHACDIKCMSECENIHIHTNTHAGDIKCMFDV